MKKRTNNDTEAPEIINNDSPVIRLFKAENQEGGTNKSDSTLSHQNEVKAKQTAEEGHAKDLQIDSQNTDKQAYKNCSDAIGALGENEDGICLDQYMTLDALEELREAATEPARVWGSLITLPYATLMQSLKTMANLGFDAQSAKITANLVTACAASIYSDISAAGDPDLIFKIHQSITVAVCRAFRCGKDLYDQEYEIYKGLIHDLNTLLSARMNQALTDPAGLNIRLEDYCNAFQYLKQEAKD